MLQSIIGMIIITKSLNLFRGKYFLSRSAIVIGASLFSNFFSYLFQLISIRYLSIEDYSRLIALFSLSGIIPLIILPITSGIPKLVAEIKDEDYPNRISSLFFSLFKVQIGVTIVVFSIMLIFNKQIGNYLNIHDNRLIITFIFAVAAGMLTSIIIPYLQGLMRFKAYSFMLLSNGLLKMLVALFVAIIGLGVVEIFGGLFLGTLLIGATGLLLLKKNLINKIKEFDIEDIKQLIKYSIGGALAIIGISLINNNDVILVKHFFDENTAGMYGSLSVIGKIVYYAATPVVIVMLPIISNQYKKGGDYKKPFLLSLALGISISTSIALLYWLFPTQLIILLFGTKYVEASNLLPLFGIYMITYTILTVLTWFLFGISKFKIASLAFIAALIQIAGVYIYNDTLAHIIWVSILACGTMSLLMGIYSAKILRVKS